MKRMLLYILLTYIFLLITCQKKESSIDRMPLLSYYNNAHDSVKLEAIHFLLENIRDQNSELPILKRFSFGSKVDIKLDTIVNDSILSNIIKEQNVFVSINIVPDTSFIENNYIIQDVDLAFETWNKYPWAENVPKDIFFNYLLPFKIYGEKPSNWRIFFQSAYNDTINSILRNINEESLLRSPNEIYYKVIVNDVEQWFIYKDNPTKLTQRQGLEELMAIKNGDCFSMTYLNVMILRSFGIPATIDFVPVWGRQNGSHATEVFWDDLLKKLRTASGRELKSPSKVFRLSYKNQNIWNKFNYENKYNKIFCLKNLMHNHWIDVTKEHTNTVNIEYQLDEAYNMEFAYICVFNYGKWEPVYYGKVNNHKVALFTDMAIDMLYRIAIPQKQDFKIISNIFNIDSCGLKKYYRPDNLNKITLHLNKINAGSIAWVEVGKRYSLYYSEINSEWTLLSTNTCLKDSIIIFKNVPSKTLYRLVEKDVQNELSRIFIYENDEQIFY